MTEWLADGGLLGPALDGLLLLGALFGLYELVRFGRKGH